MVIPVPVPAVPVSLLSIGFWEFVLASVDASNNPNDGPRNQVLHIH